MVETMQNILYGGYEGSDAEICENCESLGELVIKRLQTAGQRTVVVRHKIKTHTTNIRLTNVFFLVLLCFAIFIRLTG